MMETRREFLRTSAVAAGGFLIGAKVSLAKGLLGRGPAAAEGAWVATWVGITGDGAVYLYFAKAEMGQGVLTTLTAIVGEELGVNPAQIQVQPAPIDKAFGNPKMFGEMVTGGSTTIASTFNPGSGSLSLRQAAAAAREMLVAAGAKALRASASDCQLRNGQIVDTKTGRSVPLQQIVGAASKLRVPDSPKLKDPSQFQFLGKAQPRRDLADKVTGKAVYGIDVQSTASGRPLDCVVIHCPVKGGLLKNPGSYDPDTGLIPLKNALAVTAPLKRRETQIPTFWETLTRARALEPEWDLSKSLKPDTSQIRETYLKASQGEGDPVYPLITLFGVPVGAVQATYELPYLPHATMEPMNCTADVRKDGADIWAPTQVPGAVREITAAITGLSLDKVTVHPLYLGGGFGRRCYLDYVAEAVQVSKVVGRPVKVTWTREDDFQNDYYRPAMTHAISGTVAPDGNSIATWRHHVVGQSMLQYAAKVLADGLPVDLPDWGEKLVTGALSGFFRNLTNVIADPMSYDGLLTETSDISLTHPPFQPHLPYKIDKFEVRGTKPDPDPKVPVGFWRSVGHSHTAFAIESFVDELAHSVGVDPYQLRLKLLADAKVARNRRVLMLAAEKAGWGSPAPGVFQGIAQHECFDTYTSHVVEIVKDQGSFRVQRVVVAVDCGFVLDPDIVTAQVEGGVIFGLTAALKQEIALSEGVVQQANFDDSDLLRIHECPKIEVYFAGGSDPATGIGEAAVPGVAPALANAVFAAFGKRVRALPIKL